MSAAATVARFEGAMSNQTAATIAWQAHYTAKSGVAKVRGRGQALSPLQAEITNRLVLGFDRKLCWLRYKGVDEGKRATMDEPEKGGNASMGYAEG